MVLADANHLELFSFVYCQDYSIEQWQGRLNITGRPLYCSDTTITGFTQDNDLYWFLVLVFNCQQAGDCLIIIACFFIIARPYVTREQMFNIQSTGPKGYVY
mmetsp:Transcript_47779/g.112369  ORF Transcript_47779/g.112369 Transcript_47779/m.112369 type:complete len:102 (-) Transcript_47779:8-313(-)